VRINLRDIIDVPGGSVPFECELDTERIASPAIARHRTLPRAEGRVSNTAGVLTLEGVIRCDMDMICDRCLEEYRLEKDIPVSVPLATELSGEDDSEIYLLSGEWLELSDVLEMCFILDMDQKSLCRPDCAGLCPDCGKNLNQGPCSCIQSRDPRMAVLEQLLDKE